METNVIETFIYLNKFICYLMIVEKIYIKPIMLDNYIKSSD